MPDADPEHVTDEDYEAGWYVTADMEVWIEDDRDWQLQLYIVARGG